MSVLSCIYVCISISLSLSIYIYKRLYISSHSFADSCQLTAHLVVCLSVCLSVCQSVCVLIGAAMDNYVEQISGGAFPPLKSPCNSCISGVSGSGKTTLVHKILMFKDDIYDKAVHEILYCMSVDQPLFAAMKRNVTGIKFRRGIPSEEDLNIFTDGSRHCIVVLDDLMEEVVKSVEAQNLFTKFAHHKSISVLFIAQNLYPQGKCSRNLSMNTHYFFILCNPRDISQINILAKQTGLGDTLKNSYRDCVLKKAYGYQLISLHPADISKQLTEKTPRLQARIFTNIFPGENLITYV